VVGTSLGGLVVSGFVAGLAGCLLLVVNQQYVETSYTVPVPGGVHRYGSRRARKGPARSPS
jgi:ABC-type uncharacterized transport system permease subunit